MGRLLCALEEEIDFRLESLMGGLMDNAIPRETKAVLYVKEEEIARFEEFRQTWETILQKEFRASDPGIFLTLRQEGFRKGRAMSPKSASLLLYLLHMVPNGVVRNSVEIENLVQTSLNLGILKTGEDAAHVIFSVRSSVDTEKAELGNRLRHCVEFLGGTYQESGSYPGWEYKKDSLLRDTLVRVYQRLYEKTPRVEAIHAGLECGIFSGKMEGLDCISMGPDLYDIHTPKERLSISSVERVYHFLLEVLKELR